MKISSTILLLTLLLTANPVFGAMLNSSNAATIADLENKVINEQQKVKRLEKNITEHKSRVRTSRRQEISLLTELEKIDQTLAGERRQLHDLRKQFDDKERNIKIKIAELATLNTEKKRSQKHVTRRLASYYRMGDIGIMNIIFSSSSLPELLNFREYFDAMVKYDRLTLNNYRQQITDTSKVNEDLLAEKAHLLKLLVAEKKQEGKLATTRAKRIKLLAKVNTEKKLYQQALQEMQLAANNLTQTIAELKDKVTAEKNKKERRLTSPKKRRPKSNLPGLAAMKGNLPPPVEGTVATYFGRNTKGKFGITTYANGIDIKSKAGAEVRAIFDGKVVYSGSLRGYGNLIIIDHGRQYYSLASRMASLLRREGDTVSTGDVIGIMHEQDGLLGKGLHFEIRHGTKAQNPMNWLDTSKLRKKSSRRAKR